jgi:hypothetical protein
MALATVNSPKMMLYVVEVFTTFFYLLVRVMCLCEK